MYRILHEDDSERRSGRIQWPFGKLFMRVPLTVEEQQMKRMTFDGLLLQSRLPEGEVLSIDEIAETMFCREGEAVGKISSCRARQAALNLISIGNAKPIPNRQQMTHLRSIASPGTQLAALMSLSIRASVQNRRESDRVQQKEESPSK